MVKKSGTFNQVSGPCEGGRVMLSTPSPQLSDLFPFVWHAANYKLLLALFRIFEAIKSSHHLNQSFSLGVRFCCVCHEFSGAHCLKQTPESMFSIVVLLSQLLPAATLSLRLPDSPLNGASYEGSNTPEKHTKLESSAILKNEVK
jgi:hypothetical protein